MVRCVKAEFVNGSLDGEKNGKVHRQGASQIREGKFKV